MQTPQIQPRVLEFLTGLKTHNEKEWFEAHKGAYEKARRCMVDFSGALAREMNRHDRVLPPKHFRIYRDLRFSRDKTPYKPQFAVSFAREGAQRRGGYYLRIHPGDSFAACGFWNPEKEDLLRIRRELEADAAPFREVFSGAAFRAAWGGLQGEVVKTAPRGFDSAHPDIDLIRHKQFLFVHPFTDVEVVASDFLGKVDGLYRQIRPFFDLMSTVLTTNLDGESLLDQ